MKTKEYSEHPIQSVAKVPWPRCYTYIDDCIYCNFTFNCFGFSEVLDLTSQLMPLVAVYVTFDGIGVRVQFAKSTKIKWNQTI